MYHFVSSLQLTHKMMVILEIAMPVFFLSSDILSFQMIVNMVYYVPYYVCAIYGLLNPGQPWLPDWALILAGGAAQVIYT